MQDAENRDRAEMPSPAHCIQHPHPYCRSHIDIAHDAIANFVAVALSFAYSFLTFSLSLDRQFIFAAQALIV